MTETSSKSQARELIELAGKIREWQTAREWSDTHLCAEFDIGSTKTFNALREGRLEGYDTEDRWLPAYRQAWNLIEARGDGADEIPVYDDLTPAVRLRAALTEAMRERGTDRVIILEGDPGAGKTFAKESARNRFGARIVCAEAAQTWKESMNAMLADLLRALGVQPPVSAAEKLEKLIERLNAQRRCVAIDEAHHMGPQGLNIVKTIVNRAPGEVLLMGLPVLLTRLELDAYQEARQIIHNRLSERITLTGAEPADVERLLARLGAIPPAAAKAAAPQVARLATGRGLLKFAVRVARRAAREGVAEADEVVKLAAKMAGSR